MIANDHSFQQDEMGLSRVEYAYRKIKKNITTNIYPSGFQILEPELAEKLGVSRTPVREALIRLEADKLIQLIPRRGMRVNSLSARDVKEITDVLHSLMRSVLDTLCRASASRDWEGLEATLTKLSKFSDEHEPAQWVELEERLVYDLVFVVDNRRLRSLLKSLLEQARRVKVVLYSSSDAREQQREQLTQFIFSVKASEFEKASRCLSDYLEGFVALVNNVENAQGIKSF